LFGFDFTEEYAVNRLCRGARYCTLGGYDMMGCDAWHIRRGCGAAGNLPAAP
jgi:hypothetical protein